MKPRSTLSTLMALSTALDVNFSFFDALDEVEASAKRGPARKPVHRPYIARADGLEIARQAR